MLISNLLIYIWKPLEKKVTSVDLFHKYEKIKVSIYLPYCHDNLCFYLNAIFMLLFKKYSKAKTKITEYVSSLGGLRPRLLKSKTSRNCS